MHRPQRRPPRRPPLLLAGPVLATLLAACSDAAADEQVADAAPALAASAAPATLGEEPVRFHPRPPAPGERLLWDTRVTIDLDATVGVGFLGSSVRYLLAEEEVVEVDLLEPDDGAAVTRLHYRSRRATSRAPLVGEKTKDRRVHGKTYRVTAAAGGPQVTGDGGGAVRDKEVPYVLRTHRTVGGRPPLFDVLPAGEDVTPGTSFPLEAEVAKRLLGLPLEELDVDTLTLTLRGADGQGTAVFDASASLSGEAELGGAATRLSASLAGTVRVSLEGCRLLSVELTGTTSVSRDGGGTLSVSASGSGPLELKRVVSER